MYIVSYYNTNSVGSAWIRLISQKKTGANGRFKKSTLIRSPAIIEIYSWVFDDPNAMNLNWLFWVKRRHKKRSTFGLLCRFVVFRELYGWFTLRNNQSRQNGMENPRDNTVNFVKTVREQCYYATCIFVCIILRRCH